MKIQEKTKMMPRHSLNLDDMIYIRLALSIKN
jgi:hypothetical protein